MKTVPTHKIIEETAKDLSGLIHKPEWADFVKTGTHKERPPMRDDWWYVRAASVLRSVQRLGPVGVSKLRTKYGGKKNRGVQPGEARKGSGSILRHVLQQLEGAELVAQGTRNAHKGRIITPKGATLLHAAEKRASK